MDVISLLRKEKQNIDSFQIEARAKLTGRHPEIFSSIDLTFKLFGLIDSVIALKAVELSQTLYCGVSAMLSKSVSINWIIFLNDIKIGDGRSNFSQQGPIYESSYEG